MKRLFALVVFLLVAAILPARAQSPDDQYVRIYTLIQQADALAEAGQSSQALGKYLEAQSSLQRVQKVYPEWNPKVVTYRLGYLEGKIAVLTSKIPPPAAINSTTPNAKPASPVSSGTPSAALDERASRLAALENELRQSQADKTVMEAKLKEALSTQPAAIDARELTKAEEKIQSLMKENDLLKVAIDKQQGEAAPGVDQKALEEARQALAESNRKLSDEAGRANGIAAEKEALQKQLDSLAASTVSAAELNAAKQLLDSAKEKLAAQTEQADKLAAEKEAIQTRLTASAEAADVLRAEKEVLQKQIESLAASTVSAAELNAAKQSLDSAKEKLAAQTEQADKLAAEKDSLQSRLTASAEAADVLRAEKGALQKQIESLAASTVSATELNAAKQSLDSAKEKLAAQTEQVDKLAAEKDALQLRLNALTASAETADVLRAENEILKKQVSEMKSAAAAADGAPGQKEQLAQAQARIAALQSDAEILRLEKAGLQDRIKGTSGLADANAKRVKELESERDDLRKQLAAKEKGGFFKRNSRASAAKIKELTEQSDALRARLVVLEAQAVPYTAEELALFQKPETQLVSADTKSASRAGKEPPPGTTALAAEAQRLFAGKQYEKAEQKYLDMLRQDQSSVYTLANLAAIQLEMGRLDEAEKNVKQALASAPNDAYSLSILGYLKFRQEKYDEALDALSRAAQYQPQNAEIQNYLGVTLSHKGMRGPAESALRRAIQIDPNYGSAHNNLAVIYASQQPPLLGLARWHYQKALATGHPKNEELEKLLDQKSSNAAPVTP